MLHFSKINIYIYILKSDCYVSINSPMRLLKKTNKLSHNANTNIRVVKW